MSAKPKGASVFQFRPRDPGDDGSEVALPIQPQAAPVAVVERPKALDLTGKVKVWFAIGRGGSGKTTLIRWGAETVEQRGGQVICAAMDPVNRSLTAYREGVVEPPSNDPAEVAGQLQELLAFCMKEQASAFVDLGGGDTSLGRLLKTVPNLVDVLRDGGVEPVAVHVIGNDPHDLIPLAQIEAAGFRPPATAIVCNERLDTRDRFGAVLRHTVFREVVARGAIPLWMPYLTKDTARLVNMKHLPFYQVGNTMGPFNGAAVRLWLKAMSEEFEPITTWFP